MKTFEVQVFLTVPITLEVEAETEELAVKKIDTAYESTQEKFNLMQDHLSNGSIYLEVDDIELVSEEEK